MIRVWFLTELVVTQMFGTSYAISESMSIFIIFLNVNLKSSSQINIPYHPLEYRERIFINFRFSLVRKLTPSFLSAHHINFLMQQSASFTKRSSFLSFKTSERSTIAIILHNKIKKWQTLYARFAFLKEVGHGQGKLILACEEKVSVECSWNFRRLTEYLIFYGGIVLSPAMIALRKQMKRWTEIRERVIRDPSAVAATVPLDRCNFCRQYRELKNFTQQMAYTQRNLPYCST